MIEILKAILFGIVEGITEWLPISSTGHMILLNEIVSLNVSDEFYSMFEVVIQLGAILAVVILFWNQIWPFGKKNNKEPLAKDALKMSRIFFKTACREWRSFLCTGCNCRCTF